MPGEAAEGSVVSLFGADGMERAEHSETSVSLLLRLRGTPSNQVWSEFFRRYEPKIVSWCRARNLQEADALDVTQAVLVKLVERMATFHYDRGRSFRGYLKTLTHYAVIDVLNARKRPGQGRGGPEEIQALETLEAREDLARRLEEQFDHELIDEAMRRVSRRVEDRTWKAFQLLTFDDLPVKEVADRLEMKVASAYVSKSKVLKMIREEIDRLEQT
ncbi:RNA polymerase sigma factor [Singulisphaera sp. PoT]|uniref:RNA polymerase sigma factor n=1 Tax=Singulisphaera sp. PoT TaxID=3411797 RepID=UPI003BF5A635